MLSRLDMVRTIATNMIGAHFGSQGTRSLYLNNHLHLFVITIKVFIAPFFTLPNIVKLISESKKRLHITVQMFFNNPAVVQCMVVGLQLSLVGLQIVILVRVSEWYQVVSLALLLFANYYTLFKLSRDYLVCWKVYKAEAMIQDKISSGQPTYKTDQPS